MTADAARTAWLDQLEALHTAATPGPWSVYALGGTDTLSGEDWAEHGVDLVDGRGSAILGSDDQAQADAAAIVAEHNATGRLLALARGVAALAEELDEAAAESHRRVAATVWLNECESAVAHSLEAIADRLTRLLADAAPDTAEETA